jgi:hypothetical protein
MYSNHAKMTFPKLLVWIFELSPYIFGSSSKVIYIIMLNEIYTQT